MLLDKFSTVRGQNQPELTTINSHGNVSVVVALLEKCVRIFLFCPDARRLVGVYSTPQKTTNCDIGPQFGLWTHHTHNENCVAANMHSIDKAILGPTAVSVHTQRPHDDLVPLRHHCCCCSCIRRAHTHTHFTTPPCGEKKCIYTAIWLV